MIEWPIDPWRAAAGLLNNSERRKFDAFISNTHQARIEYLEIIEMHQQLQTVAEKDLSSCIPEKTFSLLNSHQKSAKSLNNSPAQSMNDDKVIHISETRI